MHLIFVQTTPKIKIKIEKKEKIKQKSPSMKMKMAKIERKDTNTSRWSGYSKKFVYTISKWYKMIWMEL